MGMVFNGSGNTREIDLDGTTTLMAGNASEAGYPPHGDEGWHPWGGHDHADIGLLGRGIAHTLRPEPALRRRGRRVIPRENEDAQTPSEGCGAIRIHWIIPFGIRTDSDQSTA